MRERIRETLLKECLPLLGWTALAVLYRGYAYAVGDQNLYLPFVLHWNNPDLFPNDYLFWLKFPNESFTWAAIAWLAQFIELKAVLLTLYLSTSFLTLWAAFHLGIAWFSDRWKAWVLVLLWTPVYELPGSGQDTIDPYLTTRNIAYMLAMWALVALLRSRRSLAVLTLCGGALIHLISELQVASACGLVFLRERRFRSLGVLVGAMIPCVALVLWWSGKAPGEHDMWGRFDTQWYEVAARGASCLFPERWIPRYWSHILIVLGAYVAIAIYTRYRGRWGRSETMGVLLVFSAVIWGLVAVFGAHFRLVLLVQLSLLRGHLFVVLMATVGLAGVIGALIKDGRIAFTVSGLAAAALWMTDNTPAQGLAILIALTATEWAENGPLFVRTLNALRGRARTWILGLVLFAAALYATDYYFDVFPNVRWPSDQRWLGMSAFIAVALAGILLSRTSGAKASVAALLLGITAMTFVAPGRFAVESLGKRPGLSWFYAYSRPHRFLWYRYTPLPAARERLAELVRREVPQDATVVVPAGWDSFRLMTYRSSFVTLEDMIPAEFSRRYAMEWEGRFSALYGSNVLDDYAAKTGSADLSQEQIQNLSLRYQHIHLDYILTSARYDFPCVGQVGGWNLYRIAQVAGTLPSRDASSGQMPAP